MTIQWRFFHDSSSREINTLKFQRSHDLLLRVLLALPIPSLQKHRSNITRYLSALSREATSSRSFIWLVDSRASKLVARESIK